MLGAEVLQAGAVAEEVAEEVEEEGQQAVAGEAAEVSRPPVPGRGRAVRHRHHRRRRR